MLQQLQQGNRSFSGLDNFLSVSIKTRKSDLERPSPLTALSLLENLSLRGATVLFSISENARIEPDPATVTDWDAKQTFTITSFNGAKDTPMMLSEM
ncbi:hypothetical protein MASR1M31_07740 [Porphyromonadaceae bacterium]